MAMFEANQATPERLRDLILKCETRREILEAPLWKQYIDATVAETAQEITKGSRPQRDNSAPLVPPGAAVHHEDGLTSVE